MSYNFAILNQQLEDYRSSGKRLGVIPIKLKQQIANLLDDYSAKDISSKLKISTSAIWRWRHAIYSTHISQDENNQHDTTEPSFLELPATSIDAAEPVQALTTKNNISLDLLLSNGAKLSLIEQPLDVVIKLLNGLVVA